MEEKQREDAPAAAALPDISSALDTRAGSNAGEELTILNILTGEPTPIKVKVYGPDSDKFVDEVRKQAERQTRRIVEKRGNAKRAPTMQELEEDDLDLLAATTIHFTAFAAGEESFRYTDAASAKAMFKRFPAIRDQVLAFQRERRNFLPRSAKS